MGTRLVHVRVHCTCIIITYKTVCCIQLAASFCTNGLPVSQCPGRNSPAKIHMIMVWFVDKHLLLMDTSSHSALEFSDTAILPPIIQ